MHSLISVSDSRAPVELGTVELLGELLGAKCLKSRKRVTQKLQTKQTNKKALGENDILLFQQTKNGTHDYITVPKAAHFSQILITRKKKECTQNQL